MTFRLRLAGAVVAVAALAAGCTSVVTGSGSTSLGAGPSGSAACPRVVFPAAKLSFACITTGMQLQPADAIWPLSVQKPVQQPTATANGWVLEEGAGHWGPLQGQSLATIAQTVRQRMLDAEAYGNAPSVATVSDKDLTVDGAKAHLLQTTFTIDPNWAKANGVKVKQEKLWIVAITVGADDVSLWYTSLPDLARSLWSKVPGVIASIKVGG